MNYEITKMLLKLKKNKSNKPINTCESQSRIKMSKIVYFETRDSTFSKRMLTFAIANREHVDICDFLIDAFSYFDVEIKNNW